MIAVSTDGLEQHAVLVKMLDNLLLDNNNKGLISLFADGSHEFNADIINPFERCSNTILSALHWGFIYKDKFIAKDDNTLFAENFANVPMYETYVVGGHNVAIPYIATIIKVNPNELIIVGKNTTHNSALVGIINIEEHTVTVTTRMTMFSEVLGEMHSKLLHKYLTRTLVGEE